MSSRWPGGGSLSGLTLGFVAGATFLFEMALALKKTKLFRTARWAGSAQAWMKAHIWLGLLTVPLVVLHSGGRLGGMLTTLLVAIFAIVIVSGLWGLAVQNHLPRLLLDAAPAETVYSQIEFLGQQYADEARRLVFLSDAAAGDQLETKPDRSRALEHAAIHGAPRRIGSQVERRPQPVRATSLETASPVIEDALRRDVAPFLESGLHAGGLLGSRQRNEWYFDDLRLRVAPELRPLVGQLEELCERRRQLNVQRRVHFWLHNWLWLHLPLSVLLIMLLVAHVAFALRFG